MAFTAVHYPTDKDQGQLPYWPDGEELGVASDNFFDQFVTFDTTDPALLGGGELLDDPPSPSILLDSLNGSVTNSSSHDLDTQSGSSQSEVTATTAASLDIATFFPSQAPTSDQSKSVPVELTVPLIADPVLSGGSISDSELLRLEGISLKSPKLNATAPSSPPFQSTASPSPRKHNRVLDSIYATIRRATHRSKPNKSSQGLTRAVTNGSASLADLFKREEASTCHELPDSLNMTGFPDIKLEDAGDSLNLEGLPLSPPLTGKIPSDQQGNDILNLINGNFDDPFCDDFLASPAVIHPAMAKGHELNLDTPMDTPALTDDPFYTHGLGLVDSANEHVYRSQPKQRSTSSAEWPMEGILTNDSHANDVDICWSASTPPGSGVAAGYMPDGGNPMAGPGWWDTPRHHQHQQQPSGHRNHRSQTAYPQHHQQQNQNHHQHHSDLPYDYPHPHPPPHPHHSGSGSSSGSSNPDLTGLMIHMPQPRTPQAAVLSSSNSIDDPGYYGPPAPPNPTPRHASSSSSLSRQYHRTPHTDHHHRRHRPRAPSSGARHYGAPMSSPRKISASSSASSASAAGNAPAPGAGAMCYALREESASPSPMGIGVGIGMSFPSTPGPAGNNNNDVGRPRHRASSSSLAVRKRRSWSRRGEQQQQQQQQQQSPMGKGVSRATSYENMLGGGGGGFAIEFCNYTPSDKKVLMNGVAPSGSSKTKARREREAMEHKRKMSEAYMQAIRAAGGDVEKLRQNGFFGGGGE
ncbi:uncharacterized protein GGS25DRAFT_375607 [Hypoxylon fragiforme]|uniref:uncharacterized protein n=1 Tax=Hypoxylon fragiforme TaxID=63214 RepID=UPI0020C744BE|nr:uncharacterized protein GGS25DRAFT_375607 [Hypoxylon fragiforme]KAI2606153.1 hypothetical protein GGS25DRAFT_375607 [Hypoxylon fragiforme]